MTPATPPHGSAERLVRLERIVAEHGSDIARIESQVSSNTEMIRALAPLVSQLATVAEAQRHLQNSVTDLKFEWRDDVKHFDAEIEKIVQGQKREERDAKVFHRALIAVGITAVLSPVGTLIVALAQ